MTCLYEGTTTRDIPSVSLLLVKFLKDMRQHSLRLRPSSTLFLLQSNVVNTGRSRGNSITPVLFCLAGCLVAALAYQMLQMRVCLCAKALFYQQLVV